MSRQARKKQARRQQKQQKRQKRQKKHEKIGKLLTEAEYDERYPSDDEEQSRARFRYAGSTAKNAFYAWRRWQK
jgi:hypothetical protein